MERCLSTARSLYCQMYNSASLELNNHTYGPNLNATRWSLMWTSDSLPRFLTIIDLNNGNRDSGFFMTFHFSVLKFPISTACFLKRFKDLKGLAVFLTFELIHYN